MSYVIVALVFAVGGFVAGLILKERVVSLASKVWGKVYRWFSMWFGAPL